MKKLGIREADGSITVDVHNSLTPYTDDFGHFVGYLQILGGKPVMKFSPTEVVRINISDEGLTSV